MGQTSLSCEGKPTTPRDLFSQQLNIYQWRANPNNNNFVSRVSFKNAYTQKQQIKFAQFLRQQQQQNYLEIYKFKQQVEDLKKFNNQDVIIFQKYSCTLKQLISRLKLEDVLYTLHALLIGFQEIRKIYQKIIIEDICCFVTNDGEIRAWINPNPKSNEVWTGLEEQLILQVNIKSILTKIVKLVQKCAMKTIKSQQFFRIMYSMLSKGMYKHCYYADLRRVINQYCYLNSIQMSKNLQTVIKMRQSQSQFRKSYKRQQRNTQSTYRQKMIIPTTQSESNLQAKSLLMKSKSLQNPGINIFNSQTLKRQSTIINNQQQSICHQNISHVLPTVSHIYPQNNDQLKKNSTTITQRNSYINQRPQKKPGYDSILTNKASTYIPNTNFKRSQFMQNQIIEVQSIKSNNSKSSKMNIVGNGTYKPLQNQINIDQKRSSKMQKKKMQRGMNKNMQVSIIQNIKNENYPNVQRVDTHYKTCLDRHSLEESGSDACWSRPWITTKTLTKLISDNEISLKNSIAQSSDYYNQSVYSGALTLLGRDIAPPSHDRSKTVRISRDR